MYFCLKIVTMDLSKIVAISGKSGLYLIISQGGGKLVVESLLDGKRTPTFANDKINSLEEISIFTTDNDKPLKDVFVSIHEKLGNQIGFDPKKVSPVELREKFLLILPNYDEGSVYQSDIKKIFSWYQFLNDKGLLDFTEKKENSKEENEKPEEEVVVSKKTSSKGAQNVNTKFNINAHVNSGVKKTTKKPKKT